MYIASLLRRSRAGCVEQQVAVQRTRPHTAEPSPGHPVVARLRANLFVRSEMQGWSPRRLVRPVQIVCFSFCLALAGAAARAATPFYASPQTTPESSAPSQPPIPGLPKTEPAPSSRGKTEQYTLSEERYEKAVAYSRAGYTLYFVSYFISILVLILILRTGLAARIRDTAERFTDKRWLQTLIFVPLLFLTSDVFDLPVRLYWHALSLRYEQSVQRWGSWFWDWTKSEIVSIAFALILVLILFAAIRRSPRRWWFYFWLASLPILLGTIYLVPWVIDPLFNKFEPLDQQHPALVDSIQRLTQHAGVPIPRDRIFLMRASEKTNE